MPRTSDSHNRNFARAVGLPPPVMSDLAPHNTGSRSSQESLEGALPSLAGRFSAALSSSLAVGLCGRLRSVPTFDARPPSQRGMALKSNPYCASACCLLSKPLSNCPIHVSGRSVKMKNQNWRIASLLSSVATGAFFVLATVSPGHAQSKEPIKIGVISEAQSVAGSSIPQGAQLAADEINAKGGIDGRKIQIVSYDDHSSAADAVRAFQRAANQDHVN